ncbi:MAG: succinate dehydrogenase/fumarate reductase iron-sulfur subunit [Candidatus Marinarcus sp.]|uniref:succinate dehydrogenase/fumarate reductase iron-sulfur subunit n=1 Tax=Candidatus Marinarcus sp. TaxID=3100987 RepID=UPI003B002626
MKIKISRFDANKTPEPILKEYEVSHTRALEALHEVKTKKDNTLTYRCGCGSGVCGSCSIRVNGVERLACKTHLNEGDVIEPIKYTKRIRDLVVDLEFEEALLKKTKAFLESYQDIPITKEDEKAIDTQSNCILCQSCYSSCPVYEVNKDFLGPYALTRVLRYTNDKKESNERSKIDAIQKNGIWDCTLCGNCTMVCPQFIDPKADIMKLRTKSYQHGYTDPALENNFGFNDSFSQDDFGFNPNSF